MLLPLPQISIPEFALRCAARAGQNEWMVLVAPVDDVPDVLNDVVAEVAAYSTGATVQVSDAANALDLSRKIEEIDPERPVFTAGLERLSCEEWRTLDRSRSRLLRSGGVVLILSAQAFMNLAQAAPNLQSWIGGAVWELESSGPDAAENADQTRLAHLRSWSGRSDAEVLSLAAEGRLPPDPEYAEWLILLRRGDLLGEP